MGEPVRQQQRVELAGVTVVKADHEFAAVRAETLQRMRLACGKYQRSPSLISNIGAAHGVENRHAAAAVGLIAHSAAWCQCNSLMPPAVSPHVDARDRV